MKKCIRCLSAIRPPDEPVRVSGGYAHERCLGEEALLCIEWPGDLAGLGVPGGRWTRRDGKIVTWMTREELRDTVALLNYVHDEERRP